MRIINYKRLQKEPFNVPESIDGFMNCRPPAGGYEPDAQIKKDSYEEPFNVPESRLELPSASWRI